MGPRIPASEQTHQRLAALLKEGVADGDARTALFKLAVRKIVEDALEAEVGAVVGRGYYESGAEPGQGHRNGYRRGRLRTAEGPIEYGVPQVSDRAEPFASRIRAGLAGRTAELERLAVELFARGLSTRDIEAAFQDTDGTVLEPATSEVRLELAPDERRPPAGPVLPGRAREELRPATRPSRTTWTASQPTRSRRAGAPPLRWLPSRSR